MKYYMQTMLKQCYGSMKTMLTFRSHCIILGYNCGDTLIQQVQNRKYHNGVPVCENALHFVPYNVCLRDGYSCALFP